VVREFTELGIQVHVAVSGEENTPPDAGPGRR
jgi:hypothetical protein